MNHGASPSSGRHRGISVRDGDRAGGGATAPRNDPLPRLQHTGVEAVERALDEGLPLRLVLLRRGATGSKLTKLRERLQEAGIELRETSANDLRRMRARHDEPGSSGEVEVLGFSGPDPRATPEEWMTDLYKPAWLLTGVSYPGNAGYAIRCAEVSGAAGIALAVDFDRPARLKALRASMGAHRFLPVWWAQAGEVVEIARAAGRRIVVIEDCGDTEPWNCDLTLPSMFVVGGEERGVPAELIEQADAVVRIPVAGFVPSYNLQAAMAIVAGEYLRQSAAGPAPAVPPSR